MPKYLVKYQEENWYNVVIEAENAVHAKEKFWEFDFDQNSAKLVGEEIQESIEVEELV